MTFSASRRSCSLNCLDSSAKRLRASMNLLVVGVAEAGRLSDQVLIVAFLAHLVLGQKLGVAAQHDVGTTAGHVGGDGDRAVLARLCDDLGFLLVVLGVEHLMLDAAALEQGAQLLGVLDRDGADQDRLALVVALFDLFDNGVELALCGSCRRHPADRFGCTGLLVGISMTSMP